MLGRKQKTFLWLVLFTSFWGCLFDSVPKAQAATLTTVADYLNRAKANQVSGISHEIIFTPATSVSAGADNKLILTFPDNDDGLWCRTAGSDLVVTTNDLRAGATALPGASGTATCAVGSGGSSYDTITITFPNNAINAGTLYGVRIADGSTAKLGTPTTATTGVIAVKINNGVDVDTGLVGVAIVDDDQISVTGQINPTITFDISDNAVGFGVIVSTALRYATANEEGSPAEPGNTLPSRLTVSTNGADGAVIEVRSNNANATAGLYSVSAGATLLNRSSTAVSSGVEGFGIYAKNATGLTIDEGFDDDGNADLAVDTSFLSFASVSAPVSAGGVDVSMRAGIAGATPAGSDYATILTFLATAKY